MHTRSQFKCRFDKYFFLSRSFYLKKREKKRVRHGTPSKLLLAFKHSLPFHLPHSIYRVDNLITKAIISLSLAVFSHSNRVQLADQTCRGAFF